ncbi:MAG: chromate resistance protein ChrB domain-containing protein, partial [Nocardioidaceae bacterium]
MKWVTRSSVHIDRAASAWLIARFIDDDATFAFVSDPEDIAGDAVPFDIRGVELGHHGT